MVQVLAFHSRMCCWKINLAGSWCCYFYHQGLQEVFLQVTRASVTVGWPSFIIRSVFMEQPGKLNIAAHGGLRHTAERTN